MTSPMTSGDSERSKRAKPEVVEKWVKIGFFSFCAKKVKRVMGISHFPRKSGFVWKVTPMFGPTLVRVGV